MIPDRSTSPPTTRGRVARVVVFATTLAVTILATACSNAARDERPLAGTTPATPAPIGCEAAARAPVPTTAPGPRTSEPHQHSRTVPLGTTQLSDGWFETRYVRGSEVAPSLVEVSAFPPGTAPTEAESAASAELVIRTAALAERFPRIEDAERQGFRRWEGIDDFHLVNVANVCDGHELVPTRPEFLMFGTDGTLVAAMYLPRDPGAHGPQIGPATAWHYHPWPNTACWTAAGLLPLGAPVPGTGCPPGDVARDRSPEMLHVWVVNHPAGPFSSDMDSML